MNTYKVVVERDEEGAWIARVPSVAGCHTYGRTLASAQRRVRDALSLFVRDWKKARLDFDVRLPRSARDAIRPVQAARQQAEHAQSRAQQALASAARSLTGAGFSLRDAGDLLGVSHQRIAQLTDASARSKASGRTARKSA